MKSTNIWSWRENYKPASSTWLCLVRGVKIERGSRHRTQNAKVEGDRKLQPPRASEMVKDMTLHQNIVPNNCEKH